MVWPTHQPGSRASVPPDGPPPGADGGLRRPAWDGVESVVSTLLLVLLGLAAVTAWSVVGR